MALSADELRVVRDALAIAIESSWVLPRPVPAAGGDLVRDCTALSAALDEAAREADRMRLFLRTDLARYRAALPGSAAGYVERLREALGAGYPPRQCDIDALRDLCALPAAATAEEADADADTDTAATVAERRRALLRRCEELAARRQPRRRRAPGVPAPQPQLFRPTLRALPGGRAAKEREPARPQQPRKDPPERRPAPPSRPVPTPAEVFPPRRRPSPPPPEKLLPPPPARSA